MVERRKVIIQKEITLREYLSLGGNIKDLDGESNSIRVLHNGEYKYLASIYLCDDREGLEFPNDIIVHGYFYNTLSDYFSANDVMISAEFEINLLTK